jgi:protein-tyrosine phosphatase
MSTQFERHLPVKGTFNVRDLGGYPTPAGSTQWRRILRSDGLHRLDDEGMGALIEAGVTTVIDLRHEGELATQPNPFSANPRVVYHNVSLFDQLAPNAEHTGDALYSLYTQALAERQDAIRQVLTIIADAPEGTVLFHCTAGKDRTGIVAALTLAIAGVETALILEDYALTKTMIAPMIQDILDSATARGINVSAMMPLLGCEPETMSATITHLGETYGTVEAYLKLIGMPDETIARLRARLMGDI